MAHFDDKSLWGGDPDKEKAGLRFDWGEALMTVASDGVITNTDGDYTITEDGIDFDGSLAFNSRKSITWQGEGASIWGYEGDGDGLMNYNANQQHSFKIQGENFLTISNQQLAGDINFRANDIRMDDLPTSEPSEENRIWNDNGTLKITDPATSPPSTPSAPSVCKTQFNFEITWSSVSGADHYDVQRQVDGGSWELFVSEVSGTQVNDPDPASDQSTEYCYRVRACNSGGCSSYSNDTCSIWNIASDC